jgi:hypothetical protein
MMRQPWLRQQDIPGDAAAPPDDFSPRSATMPSRRAALALAAALLLLAAGRSEAILDAAYGLPVAPGTEAAIAGAEAWNGALAQLGVPDAMRRLRGLLSAGR